MKKSFKGFLTLNSSANTYDLKSTRGAAGELKIVVRLSLLYRMQKA